MNPDNFGEFDEYREENIIYKHTIWQKIKLWINCNIFYYVRYSKISWYLYIHFLPKNCYRFYKDRVGKFGYDYHKKPEF